MLAVATVHEAVAIREMEVKCPILVLGDTPAPLFGLLAEFDLTQTVHNLVQGREMARFFEAQEKVVNVHWKVDSGMGRLGFLAQPVEETVSELVELAGLKNLKIAGIYTHFACSEDVVRDDFTKGQCQKLREVVTKLEEHGVKIPIVHSANSGGVLYHSESHCDMIRPGISLYGYDPKGCPNPNLKPVLKLKSRVAVLRPLKKGSEISYGSIAVLQRDSLVAVLPVGYGDGYSRQFSNGMEVIISGKRCPVLGKVCMDMTMVDVTDLGNDVSVGSVATLYGIEDLVLQGAERARTNSYELLCNISQRVPRVVIE